MQFHELINAYVKKYLPLLIVLYIFGLALQAFLGILVSSTTVEFPNAMTMAIVYSIVSILEGLLFAGIILLLIEMLRELRGTDRGQGNDMAEFRN